MAMAKMTPRLQASALMAVCVLLWGGLAIWPAQAFAQEPDAATPSLGAFGLPSGLVVTASAMPGAMVALDVMDPCSPDTDLTISHAGLRFGARTDKMGLLTIDLPALETPAFVTVQTADGAEAMAMAGLPDLGAYLRVAILWEGDLGLELHAFAQGADFGMPGHIWHENPGDLAATMQGGDGVLTDLGGPHGTKSLRAQVLTMARSRAAGTRIALDIPIKPETCGLPLAAEAVQQTETGALVGQAISVTLPGCDAVGDFLVLQNLFDAPRLRSN